MTELLEFSLNTENPESNYNLAKWYENQGHTSAAHTYYLRASERTEDKFFAYQALIRASFCYTIQGSRDGTEKVLLENALTYLPERPEAYYYLSVLYEKKQDWQNCYIYATLGLNCCKSEIESLDIPEFQGDHLLIFQKAISSWWWGKGKESRELFQLLSDEYYDLMDNRHKNLIDNNMDKLGLVKNKTRILKDSNNYDIYLTTEKKSDHIYSSIIEESLEYALNHESHLPEWVLNMEGMSGKKYRTFINKLISLINNPHYLEIGCWTGSTSVSAMHSNEIKATLIDKWAEDFGNPKEEFFSNLNRCGNKNITFINDDFKNIEYPSNKKYNVYLYDGPHTEEDQYNGLLIPFDSLDDEFIFICDDWNWGPAVDGTIKAIEKLKLNVLYSIEIKTTNYLTTEGDNGNHKQFSDWHNGYYIAVCKKPQPIQDESKKEMMQNIPNQPVMPQVNKKRIFDCFRFFNEKELLELRYHILKDHVDKFVILQGTKTQSGNPCELLAEKYIAELNLPQEKFIVVDVELPSNDDGIDTQEEDIIFRQLSGQSNDTYQNSLNARSRERILLDSLLTVVKDQRDSDVFLVSDCDEIIKPEYVNWFTDMVLQCPNQLIKVPLVELQGRANLRAYSSETNQPISTNNVFFICTKKHFDKCTPFRMRFDINNPFEVTYITLDGARVEECGWHFSWMGDTNRLKLKQKSTSHYADQIESAIIADMSSKELEDFIENWKPENDGVNPWGYGKLLLKEYSLENLPKQIFEYEHLKNFFLNVNNFSILNIANKFDLNGSEKEGGTDKFNGHSYLEIYQNILNEYVEKEGNLLEIGIFKGASLLIWSELLTKFKIIGLDVHNQIDEKVGNNLKQKNTVTTIFKDAYDINTVNELKGIAFDIIIDDGPHTEESQIECIKLYIPLLSENGILIIEDIQDINTIQKLKFAVSSFEDYEYELKVYDERSRKNNSDDIVFTVVKKDKKDNLNRTKIINELVKITNAKKYLEIGIADGLNLSRINCHYKIGVDPNLNSPATFHLTSDEFFEKNNETFDVIFIDGLHHADQVLKDIENSLNVLNDNGYIVCHDMNPEKEEHQLIPMQEGFWTGDCWKAFINLRQTRNDLEMFVVNTDHGCGVICKGNQDILDITEQISYQNFDNNRKEWLNLIECCEFTSQIKYQTKIPVIGVPIVNGVHWIQRLIESIDYPVKDFFIINNNGRDQITDELNKLLNIKHNFIDNIKICHLPSNIGVSATWNLIIKSYMMEPYWIICNNDVSFTPGFLEEMVTKSKDEEVGIVWPPSTNEQFASYGLGSFECFLLKDTTVKHCGLFDENLYPAYCEDCDYLLKIKKNNIKGSFVYSSFYHGDTEDYSQSGSQTLRIEGDFMTKKIFNSHMLNKEYLFDVWGNDWENWYQFANDNYVLHNKDKSYDIEFNRRKYLGF